FAAGIGNQANGEYGRIDLGSAPTLNAPPVVVLSVPAGPVTGTVTLAATVTDPGTIWSSSPCITSVAAADKASHQWPVLLGSGTVAPGRGLDQAARIFRRLLEHS